jgi:hypothetical protein
MEEQQDKPVEPGWTYAQTCHGMDNFKVIIFCLISSDPAVNPVFMRRPFYFLKNF